MHSMELSGRCLERGTHSKLNRGYTSPTETLTTPCLSQAWDLLEGKTLFSARKEDGSFSDGVHFAELIAALGPPPPELLSRNRNKARMYWDENGTCR
jgi:hypothetical protein